MKLLLMMLLAFLTLPNAAHSSQIYNHKELVVTSESTTESIELAKHLMIKV